MRLLGYCTECHRFRYVRTTSQSMAMMAARVSTVCEGTCYDCEEAEDKRRKAARAASGRRL